MLVRCADFRVGCSGLEYRSKAVKVFCLTNSSLSLGNSAYLYVFSTLVV